MTGYLTGRNTLYALRDMPGRADRPQALYFAYYYVSAIEANAASRTS